MDHISAWDFISLYTANTSKRFWPQRKQVEKIRQVITANLRYQTGFLTGVYSGTNTLTGAAFFLHHSERTTMLLFAVMPSANRKKILSLLLDYRFMSMSGSSSVLVAEDTGCDADQEVFGEMGFSAVKYYKLEELRLSRAIRSFL
jgi:hypothetical protein